MTKKNMAQSLRDLVTRTTAGAANIIRKTNRRDLVYLFLIVSLEILIFFPILYIFADTNVYSIWVTALGMTIGITTSYIFQTIGDRDDNILKEYGFE